jgi:hypothetical protein
MPGPVALGGQALTPIERKRRSVAVRKDAVEWLSRRLPNKLERYRLKVGGEDGARLRQALEEARRLGWLKKPVEDD